MRGAAPSDETRRAFAEGARRFDAGRWFEAHETWEDAWRAESGDVRRLLQGLIQVAAAFHKGLVQGRPAGMVRLLEAGLGKVAAGGGEGLLDVAAFRAGIAPWLAAARRWADGGERPALPAPRVHAW